MVFDEQDKKWYETSPLLFIEVTHYITATKKLILNLINLNKFFADFYWNKKIGSGYVVGNFEERKKPKFAREWISNADCSIDVD